MMINIELPLTGRKRLLKTTPSPGGSGELETSPLLTHFVRCGARPRCTLAFGSGRLTGGYTARFIALARPKSFDTFTTSHTRQPLCEIAKIIGMK